MKKTVTLSEDVPSSTDCAPSGTSWTGGTQATIWEEEDGTFSFCLHGVDSRTGLAWEGDDQTDIESAEEVMQLIAYRVLRRSDFAAGYRGKLTPRVKRFLAACEKIVPAFDRIELWGMPDPRGGEEAPTIEVY